MIDGDHGFINNQTSMFPIFVAHGPAFKSGGYKVNNFHNVDIYSLMCFILGIQPG
jgi:ectonucleotide pyrophosphatase/phosphodiesterase family protein 5